MDPPAPPFGALLRRLRNARGLSLREAATETQYSKTLVWEWETGHKTPGPDDAARLDLILDASGELIAAAAAAAPVERSAFVASEIARHYAHQGPVAEEIRQRAAEAKELDVLAVRALGLFALKDSMLRPALMGRTIALQVRILLLDPDAETAGHRAAEIGESPASFAAGIRLAVARLAEVAAAGMPVDLDVRLYSSLPIWRIIRVDETLWVSSFGATWEGHESTVYEIQHTPRGSLAAGYRRQFEDMHAHARRVI